MRSGKYSYRFVTNLLQDNSCRIDYDHVQDITKKNI